ncbi:MAG: hypothetical protein MK102_04270 [Fuerstiella sp.]|nr:hypothetical protein [Fuerstiella sp.]
MGQFSLSANFEYTPTTLRDYLGTVSNIPLITDPDLEIEIMEAPEVVTAGEEISFSIMTGGFRQVLKHRWTTVTDSQIVTEQVMGPAQSWEYTQTISATAGGCLLQETVLFEPPGGMLGVLVTEATILESLNTGTAIRHRLITEQLIAGQHTK